MKIPNVKTTGKYLRNIQIVVLSAVLLLISYAIISSAQERAVTRKAVKVNPKILETYVGQYQLAPKFIITISKKDSTLFAQATGQPKVEIFPESETEFFYKVVDAQITFVKDDNGKVIRLILHQSGQDITGKKISDEVPGEQKEIQLAQKILDAYIGNYQLAPNFILTIIKEDNRLFAQATGQVKIEIFPESETKFFYKVVDAQITFLKDDDGTVKELILHQNGDHYAKRIE